MSAPTPPEDRCPRAPRVVAQLVAAALLLGDLVLCGLLGLSCGLAEGPHGEAVDTRPIDVAWLLAILSAPTLWATFGVLRDHQGAAQWRARGAWCLSLGITFATLSPGLTPRYESLPYRTSDLTWMVGAFGASLAALGLLCRWIARRMQAPSP